MMSTRSLFARIAAAFALFAAAAAPAAAQTPAATIDQGGPSLLWVWVWILVVGIIVFVVGTSMGARKRPR